MTTPPIASVTTGPVDPARAAGPYHVQAIALVEAQDRAGLEALDTYLAQAGYDPAGVTRTFIAQALAAWEG